MVYSRFFVSFFLIKQNKRQENVIKMEKYKVIFWDFDGTVADTGRDVWNSIQYAAQKCGGKIPEEFRKDNSNLGKPIKDIYQEICPYSGDEKLKEFDEWITKHYRQLSEYEDTHMYAGIREILESMRNRNIKNYIITMKPQKALERILKIKHWENLFDGWLSPDSLLGNEKSKSELIQYLINVMTYEKSKFIYIGDTWSDVVAAHNNGIACMGVSYGDGDAEKLRRYNPEYFVNTVEEIKKNLEEGV